MKKILVSCFLIFASLLNAAESHKVIRVSDGDTISIDCNGKKESVRLIGIDAPESKKNKKAYKDSDRENSDLDTVIGQGRESAAFVRSVVKKGDRVTLEFDVQKRDRYGRMLAYVYLSDGRMLNEVIIAAGYAGVMTVPPNVKYENRFRKAYRIARENRLGLWRE